MKVTLAVCMALLALVWVQAVDKMRPPVLPAGSRVANGRPATPRQFPFMAYIEPFRGDGVLYDRCAGSLITRSAVLTRATSCVFLESASRWTVRLGSIYRQGEDPNAWSVESITAMRHPKYNGKTWDNNIAIIHLPRLAPVNEFIQPVHLACSPVDSSYVGRQAIVAGWGYTSDGSGPSDVLHWAKVLVAPNHYCKQFAPSYAVTDQQLCAGSDNATVYYYDYGAPLVFYTRGSFTQIGLFSWFTNSTFNTPYPAIYTRVSSYIDWIKLYTESD